MSEKELQNRIEELESKFKPKKGFWNSLNPINKTLAVIVGIGTSVVAIATATIEVCEFVFRPEIEEYKALKNAPSHLLEMDSTINARVKQFTEAHDELTTKIDYTNSRIDSLNKKGSQYYAVGFRAGVDENGHVYKCYRDWTGAVHKIFPDPEFMQQGYTYYYYPNPETGEKIYCFSK